MTTLPRVPSGTSELASSNIYTLNPGVGLQQLPGTLLK
jgi:hypothetical protein